MTIGYSLLSILILPMGITLTVITIVRIRSGRITLPQWARLLVILGMILSQVILVAAMMPTQVYQAVQDAFIGTDTHQATPIDPSTPLESESDE